MARVDSLWTAVFLVGLAAAAHTGFAANLYTIVSDTVPRKAVSSVVGIGGAASGLGMLVLSTSIGHILDWTNAEYGVKDYLIPFAIAGSAYLVATALIHLLLPRLEPMAVDEAQAPFPTPKLTTERKEIGRCHGGRRKDSMERILVRASCSIAPLRACSWLSGWSMSLRRGNTKLPAASCLHGALPFVIGCESHGGVRYAGCAKEDSLHHSSNTLLCSVWQLLCLMAASPCMPAFSPACCTG